VLDTLAAGITSGGYMQGKSSQFTIGGIDIQVITQGNSGHSRLTLNGIPDDPAERLSGATYSGFVPSLEAVQEVKTQTSLYDAQYGHGNGTVVNTVVRNGTNQLHGAAYYVFQNTYLNANNYERVPNQNGAINPASPTRRPNDQFDQTGFVLDGPVMIPHLYNGHNKSFFMVAYERFQSHRSIPFSTRVPTDAERHGDFSALCSNFVAGVCTAGDGIQIYDPTTVGASGNRTPYLNNIIASSRFNAAGTALLKYFPEPNTSNGINNYISNQTSYPNSLPSFIVRVDQACRCDVICVSAIIFRGEGDIGLLLRAWLRSQRSDHKHQISFGGSATLKYGPRISLLAHFFSASPSTLTLDTTSLTNGQVFQTDVTGDGTTGDPAPGTLAGDYMHRVKPTNLGAFITNYNNTVANTLTPAGKAVAASGLITQAQLIQMGAAIQPIAQLPQTNGVFNPTYRQIDAQVSYPIALKRLREGMTLEPVIAFYNAGNFSNFANDTSVLQNTTAAGFTTNSGTAGFGNITGLNNLTTQASKRTVRGIGTFDQGAQRTVEYQLHLNF